MTVGAQFYIFAAAFAAATSVMSLATINLIEREAGEGPEIGGIEPAQIIQGFDDPDPDNDGDMRLGPRMGRLCAHMVAGFRFKFGPLPARNLTNYMMAQQYGYDFLSAPAYRDMRIENKDELMCVFLVRVFKRTRADQRVNTLMGSQHMLEYDEGVQTWRAWYQRLLGVSDDFGTHGVMWSHHWLLGWRKVRAPAVSGRPLG